MLHERVRQRAIVFGIFVCRKIFVGGVSWDTKKGSEQFASNDSYYYPGH